MACPLARFIPGTSLFTFFPPPFSCFTTPGPFLLFSSATQLPLFTPPKALVPSYLLAPFTLSTTRDRFALPYSNSTCIFFPTLVG